jgi:NAD(P)H-hydrate epimerase
MSSIKPQGMPSVAFWTTAGVEVPAVTTDQMREIDRIAMEDTGPNLFQMMENAGRNLASLAMELLGAEWSKAAYVVLAGPGGNGGGGICAARHLANRGLQVRLCLTDPAGLGEVPAFQRKVFQGTFGQEISPAELASEHPNVVLDAVFGYGLKSAPRGASADVINWANESTAPVLALDIPSGLDATTGEARSIFINARWTMTLALPKTGLTSDRIGELFLADIGIPAETYRRMGLKYIDPFQNRYWMSLKSQSARAAQ